MIEFYSENGFSLSHAEKVRDWIASVIESEGFQLGEISYVFCDDEYLLGINKEFLNHDFFTDIISFDYSLGKEINGEIYISTQRVEANSIELQCHFDEELLRVIIHGVLHYCGHTDATKNEQDLMRELENKYLAGIEYK